MKANNENPGKILDQAIEEIRNAPVSAEAVEKAAAKVRHRLQEEYYKVLPYPSASEVDRIQSCEDFRALIPAYLTASLTPSRRLLFEDHVRECVSCRKAQETAKRGASGVSAPRPVRRQQQVLQLKWIAPLAAALLIAVGLQTSVVREWLWPIDVHAVVQMVDGGLFRVSGHDVQGVKAGFRVERGQTVRTGTASGAMLELADGTRVEMASKSELALVRARDGVKVKLARGNVIVTAAKQHGHLYVETSDCNVSVVGTVFSVSAGIKGSRVAVIEGEVQVEGEGIEESLLPGEQTYTNPAMGPVPIGEEIGWSRNAEAMLRELQAFGQDFASRTERESMRHTSKLVGLVPADTLVFASLPNVSQQFKDSYALFRQRVSENTVLSSWWQQSQSDTSRMNLDEMANRFAEVGAYLGSEVVFAFPKTTTGPGSPLLLAEAARPETLVSALEGDLRRLTEIDGTTDIKLARNAAELAAMSGTGLVIYVDNGLMIASNVAQEQRTAAIQRGPITNTFSGTPLYRRLEQAYNEGVGWLLAVDLQQLVAGEEEARQLGFENVQQLVLEQKTGIGSAASQVALGFTQERRGLPAWLGAPAPMGALDFVSSDAYGFSAWITKDPELILDDVLSIGQGDNDLAQHLRALEESHRLDLRRDLAEPLGNEVLVALDGPLLPTPSWKLVFEVNDAPKLENTIQWAVTNLNRELEAKQLPPWSLESETVDGKTYYALTSAGAPVGIHYTSWMGYMIFAPSRALVTEAIRIHDSGNSINRSAAFRAELPPDGRDTASAIMYQNLAAMANNIPAVASDLGSKDVRDSLRTASLFESNLPKVVFVYGEQDRILASAKGSFGIRIASMLGMSHLAGASGIWDQLH